MLALALALVTAPPTSGASAFVVDAGVTVREKPADDAAAVKEIPIWTAVRVDAIENGWARVVVGPRTLKYDSPGAEAKPVAPSTWDPAWPKGFVRVASLDVAPEGRLGLVARAKAATGPERGVLLLRAFTLDPNDPEVQKLVTSTESGRGRVAKKDHAPFPRADLVFGCHGDLARAAVVVATLTPRASQPEPADACAAHVDLRAPCDKSATAQKAALARFVPRFGNDGPALRLVPGLGAADRPVFLVSRLVAADGCSDDCQPLAAATDVHVDRLRVPRVDDGRTLLHVMVPRYTGALYDLVPADAKEDIEAEPLRFEIPASFDVDPRDEAGPGVHLFTAPDACCSCDDDRER